MFQLFAHVLWRSSMHVTWWRGLGLTGDGHSLIEVDVQRAASNCNQRALLLSHYRWILQKKQVLFVADCVSVFY